MDRRRKLIPLLVLLAAALLVTGWLNVGEAAANDEVQPTPVPDAVPTAPPDNGGTNEAENSAPQPQSQTIYHNLVFPSKTISDSITKVFSGELESSQEYIEQEYVTFSQAFGELVGQCEDAVGLTETDCGGASDYNQVAQSGWPVAAALAPALFVLRIALYKWNRLVGEEDTIRRVIGDWLTGGIVAILAGPFLDVIARLGWWTMGKVMGEAHQLAATYIDAVTLETAFYGVASTTLWGSWMGLALLLGGLLALAGLLLAFAVAQSMMFVLAVIGPSVAVMSVTPHLTWLRGLWLKAVTIVAIMPLVAGGIFKGFVALGAVISYPGLLTAFVRIAWLFGATGFLLSLAGILGKTTLSASADAMKQMFQAARAIVSTAALAATGVGAGAVPAALSTTAGAAESLGSAQAANTLARSMNAMGLGAPASLAHTLSHGHEIAARRAELQARISQGRSLQPGGERDFGFSPLLNEKIGSSFEGTPDEFKQGFAGLSRHILGAGIPPENFIGQYAEETARMTRTYLDHQAEIDGAGDPLWTAADLALAERVKGVLIGRPTGKKPA